MFLLNKIKLIFILFFLTASLSLFSQTRKSLEKQRQKTEKEIEKTSELIKEVEKNSKASYEQFLLLNEKISSINKKIAESRRELRAIEKDLRKNTKKYETNNHQLKILKDEYAKLIVSTYKYKKKQDKLLFIFSSKSFNQAYRRLKYMGNYIKYRRHQAEQIVKLQKNIDKTIKSLNKDKDLKKSLLSSIETSSYKLLLERDKKDALVSKLKREKRKLMRDLDKKKKLSIKLNANIKKLLAEEIQRERRRRANRKLSKESEKNIRDITNRFSKQKGKLLWPTKGVITGKYGKHAHPIFKNILVKNSGITITAKKNSNIRAVFDGVVTRVFTVPGSMPTIMIKHGKFYTVYDKVSEIKVVIDQKVKRGEIIGKVSSNASETNMDFHIRKLTDDIASKTLNPEVWLQK